MVNAAIIGWRRMDDFYVVAFDGNVIDFQEVLDSFFDHKRLVILVPIGQLRKVNKFNIATILEKHVHAVGVSHYGTGRG